jgi:1-acyl-sn-glycerol-3-phosphate acyltransferase
MSKDLNTFWLGIRATLFWLGVIPYTIMQGLLIPIYFILPYSVRYPMLLSWAGFSVWWLRVTCGVKYQIRGEENLAENRNKPHIVLANHQSTWETMAIAAIIPPFAWVLKRELFKVPFFGWAVKLAKPIGIDRTAGSTAIDQVKEQGKARLEEGIWVCMFPEGTRVAPGKKVRYKMGGAILASYTGYPILPMAHNAGECWPRHSYIKKPGMITISIGKPIQTTGRDAGELIKEVEAWIENEKARLPPAH